MRTSSEPKAENRIYLSLDPGAPKPLLEGSLMQNPIVSDTLRGASYSRDPVIFLGTIQGLTYILICSAFLWRTYFTVRIL